MNKKVVVFLGMFLFSIILASFLVSAGAAEQINNFIDGVVDFFQDTKIFPVLLGETPDGEFLFAKVLFLIIILSIVFLALGKIDFFSAKPAILWIVSIIVSILATRWIITEGIIKSIILPYSVLGIAIAAGLPFVIYFIVVAFGMPGSRYKTFRKIAWILFAVIFIGLWIVRADEIPWSTGGWIYPITALVALIMIWMDGTIQKWRSRMRLERTLSTAAQEKIYKLEDELEEKAERLRKGGYEGKEADYKKEVKNIKKRIETLGKGG